jgi:hypothetical protein
VEASFVASPPALFLDGCGDKAHDFKFLATRGHRTPRYVQPRIHGRGLTHEHDEMNVPQASEVMDAEGRWTSRSHRQEAGCGAQACWRLALNHRRRGASECRAGTEFCDSHAPARRLGCLPAQPKSSTGTAALRAR